MKQRTAQPLKWTAQMEAWAAGMTTREMLAMAYGLALFRYRLDGSGAWRSGYYDPWASDPRRWLARNHIAAAEVDLWPQVKPADISAAAWECELARRGHRADMLASA
jgi:hypothetical protein